MNPADTIRVINFGRLLHTRNYIEYGSRPTNPPGCYHKGQARLHELVNRYVLASIDQNSCVLDLGCRNLDLAVFLKNRVRTVLNVDISPEVVDWAHEHGFEAVCASAENLPVTSGSVDLFHASHVFEHVPDLAKTLFEAMRVLRFGGRLFARVPLQSYYRHHRYYIGSTQALANEIARQGHCVVICSEDAGFLGSQEGVLLIEKTGEAEYRPRRYAYDLIGTMRGVFWRFTHRT